jgi:myo-inositol catabolism protein IolC
VNGHLFVLAIDHRASFRAWSAGMTGAQPPAARLAELKDIVAQALETSPGPAAREETAILADTEYGAAAIRRCLAAGMTVVVPVERSGQPEFIFEHGEQFARAIEESKATAVKALVRYNPAGDAQRNGRSRRRLQLLDRWCQQAGYQLMLELLVPPAPDDLEPDGKVTPAFDAGRRPGLTCQAIGELREAGLEPAWWKLEAQPDDASFAAVARAAGSTSDGGGCLVLGRGAGAAQVRHWVATAAMTSGFRGFAVGRTLWSWPLAEVLRGRLSRDRAAAAIGAGYASLREAYLSAEQCGGDPGLPAAMEGEIS